jgi:hypothetical protein
MSITTTPYGFNPSLTSGLVLWLDASDATTITQSGGNISQWRDKSTSALTATATNNPTLVANIQNGFPGISLDGSTQYFNLGNNLSMGTNQLYIFVVSKFNSTADGAIIGKSLYGASGGRYSLLRAGAMVPLIEASGGAVNNSGLNSDTSTSSRLLNMVWDRSTIYLYQNGSSVFSVGLSDSSNLTTGNSLLIGAYQNGSGGTPPVAGLYMNGYIHEILMYMTPTGSPLGDTARQQIESYLAQKWGLTLGTGHPGLTSTVYRSTYLKNSSVKRNIATMTPFFTGFSPRQIPGCALWFDGTDSSTITLSSGSLTQWNDKSGNGRNLTAVSGYANATVSSAFQNGLNVFNFSGNGLYRTAGGAVVYPQDVYIVVALKSTTTHVDVLGMGDTATDNFNGLVFGEHTASRWHNGSSFFTRTPNCVSPTNETSTGFLLIQWSLANGNFLIRRNGVQLVQTASYTYSFTNLSTSVFQIGFRAPFLSAANFSGYIGEIVVFNSQLGSTDMQNVESYLAQKWGLVSSLPAGHLHLTQPAGARTALSLANSKLSIISRRITAFTSFRWTITVGNTETYIQISEFQVGYNNTQVVFVSPSISTSGTPNQWYGPEPAPAAVDNNIGSKALALAVPALFTVTVASPITVNMYRWASANDSTPSRNPTQWTVDGSADGVTFVRLHTQNTTYAGPNTNFTYTSWINFTY